jgi:hypothetical protein
MLAAFWSNSSGICIAIRRNAFAWIHLATRAMSYWSLMVSRDNGGEGEGRETVALADISFFFFLGKTCGERVKKICFSEETCLLRARV